MRYSSVSVVPGVIAALFFAGAGLAEPPDEILSASGLGVKGGLVVHIGCGDGIATAALCANDSYVVQGLDADPDNVAQARKHLRAKNLYGRATVDTFDGRRLPYVDNLVNLVVAEDPGEVPADEVMRVLAPLGVAYVKRDGQWTKTIKPWPDEIDQWTHHLHGPDNNAVAEDRVVGPPRHMQWLAGPKWTRHHHADKGTYPAIRAVVSSNARLYYMVDETKSSDRRVPSTWFLAARDAFSGVLLWKKPLQHTTFDRRLEGVWRTLVADDELVFAALGPDQPLSALDGATGRVIRQYGGTVGLQEFIKNGDNLFAVGLENRILALHVDSDDALWQWAPDENAAIVPLTLAASDEKVFVKTDTGVYCLSADHGKVLWSRDLQASQKKIRLRWPRERLLVKNGVVLVSYGGTDPKVLDRDKFEFLGSHPRVRDYGGKLAALSADDGSTLWTTDYLPGLESMPGEIYISNGLVWLGPDFAEPRDLRTGKVTRSRPVLERLWTTGHHYRCYPGKATSKYIITAKRGIEMIDLAGERHSRNNWVRATCRVGVTPCNGLLYAPPHSCGCYMEAKLYGFWALAAARGDTSSKSGSASGEQENEQRLQRGPAYADVNSGSSARRPPVPSAWRTYRSDSARSGSTTVSVPAALERRWKSSVGGRLSALTVADDKVFVAQVDAQTVHALDADSGKSLWQFTVGGRVDSPPTLYRGLALFGSNDGWVYCVRASDGVLAWRFQAAPKSISAVAFDQIESVWPVHGSVLVCNNTAYVAAGRSSYLDDGIVLYGLDPETGEVRSTTRLASQHTGALDPPSQKEQEKMAAQISQNYTDYKTFLAADRSDAFSMRGALTDVLVADGNSIFMRDARFDKQLVRQEKKSPHLFSTSSLLDDTEHHRSYWVFGTGDFTRTPVAYPWIVTKKLAVPYGLMLAFDKGTVWCVRRVEGKGQKSGYAIFAAPRPDPSDDESLRPDFAARTGAKLRSHASWAIDLSMRPRALIRANDTLVVGGEMTVADSARTGDPDNAADDDKEGVLLMVSDKDGTAKGNQRLESPPVWDGMAAAAGRLYVSLSDGSVVCLSGDD